MTSAPDTWRRFGAPSLDATRERLRQLAPAAGTPLALYALYTLVLFVVSLVATFPHDLVLRRILARTADTPVAVEAQGVRLGWTLAYAVDDLRLLRRGADSTLPLLVAGPVRAAPSLLGLLGGHPYPLALDATLYGGNLDATIDLRPAAYDIDAQLADVDLGRYGGLGLYMEGRLLGRVTGRVTLRGDAQKPTTANGSIELDVAGLALEGGKVVGITVPDLHFATLRLAGTVRGGRLEITELSANGREVSLRGDGNVLLQQPLAASLINLDLALTPAPDLPDNLRLSLNLIPGEVDATGARRTRLYGSLAHPRVAR